MGDALHKPVRKHNRLPDYDYAQCGSYFVTICTADHGDVLCCIRESNVPYRPAVMLTPLGKIAQWTLESQNVDGIRVEKYVIMPNHIHFLLFIEDGLRSNKISVSDFVGRYKSIVAHEWLMICKAEGVHMGAVWQRSFHDHVVRNQQDYDRIWTYIEANPSRWREDCFHPER